MFKTFQEIRKIFPTGFLLLENYVERTVSPTEAEICGAESFKNYKTLKEVLEAYKNTRKSGKQVLFCTPKYIDSFIIKVQPSARILG